MLFNSDAAIFEAFNCKGVGVIMYDHSGNCLASCRQHIQGLLAPEYAEAMAIQIAVQFAIDQGKNDVIFASDCLPLVQRLNSLCMDRSSVGLAVSNIKHLVRDFTSVSFRHVKRVLNEAAHLLAKSCENVNYICVFDSIPEFIRKTFCIDVV
jgi:hypothetical protein